MHREPDHEPEPDHDREPAATPRRYGLLHRVVLPTLGCAVLLGALAMLVRSGGGPAGNAVVRLDQEWVDALHGYARRRAIWTASMQTLTDIGGPLTMRLLLGLAAAWLWAIGARMLAGWAAAVLLVGWVAGWAGKAVVGRARPQFTDPVSYAPGAAFPSGHALASAITCVALVALVWPQVGRAGRVAACTVGVLVSGTVGWTRAALGVHWPSDVLAGWLTAGLVVGVVTVAVELWRPDALAGDVRRVNRRTRPGVRRVLASEASDASRGDHSSTDPDAQ